MKRGTGPRLYLILSIGLCLAGLAGFVWVFVRDFTLYWLILSPVIIAVYQIPAAFFFWLYKRKRARAEPGEGGRETAPDPDVPAGS